MQAFVANDVGGALSESQRRALVNLLGDEDPAIHRIVRERILTSGADACGWLRPHTLSSNPLVRRRAIEIINYFVRQETDVRFLEFCRTNRGDLDLETGVGLLAQTKYPECKPEAYSALYDAWATVIRDRVGRGATTDETLRALNQFLFDEVGLTGHPEYTTQTECCYVNRIVDRRSGNPIGLCSIYLSMSKRLQLPVAGIGLPSHFLCRYQSNTQEIYIDCYRRGTFLTKADCVQFLLNSSHGWKESYLAPVNSHRILLRMCYNLVATYGHLELTEEAIKAQRYVAALTK